MTTITGKIENSAGETLHAKIVFTSQSTPQFYAGVVETNTAKTIKSDASTGEFELQLAAGNYRVEVTAKGLPTIFTIAVPDGDDTFSIEDLVTTAAAALPGDPPNELWNGIRAGHLEFDPIANPIAPSMAEVAYVGGTIADGSTYAYFVTYETQEGETGIGTMQAVVSSETANRAIRVTTPANPTRVVTKRIWRNYTEGDLNNFDLLAEIPASVTTYDDFESHADFDARRDSITPPEFNTTAGIIYAQSGEEILYFSTSGLRVLNDAQFDAPVNLRSATTLKNAALLEFQDDSATQCLRIQGAGLQSTFTAPASMLFSVNGDYIFGLTTNGVRIPNAGEAAGKVLTSDANGYATWQDAAGGAGALAPDDVDPEGVKTATPGVTYLNKLLEKFWVKKTGSGNTGWLQLI